MISNMQQKPHHSRGYPGTEQSQRLSEDPEEISIPDPIFRKKTTQGSQGGNH